MKHTYKKMPTLLLMAGLPGSGKTTLARKLEKRLNWHVIDKDSIKEQYMCKGLSDDGAAWQAYEDSFGIISISLNIVKASVILDSSLIRDFVWESAKNLAHNSGANLKVLHCMVDNDIRMRRLERREALISQQTVATYTTQPEPSQFIHLPDDTFAVNTETFSENSMAQIIHYVTS